MTLCCRYARCIIMPASMSNWVFRRHPIRTSACRLVQANEFGRTCVRTPPVMSLSSRQGVLPWRATPPRPRARPSAPASPPAAHSACSASSSTSIPLNGGKHAYVRNLTNGKTVHLRTDSDAFVEEIRVLTARRSRRQDPRRTASLWPQLTRATAGTSPRSAWSTLASSGDRLTSPGSASSTARRLCRRVAYCYTAPPRAREITCSASTSGWADSPPLLIYLVVGAHHPHREHGHTHPGVSSPRQRRPAGRVRRDQHVFGVATAAAIGAIIRRLDRVLPSATGAVARCWNGSGGGSPSTSARTTWPGGEGLRASGGVGRLLRPLRRPVADPGRPARRRAARPVPPVPGRQCQRRHRVGPS